MNAADSNPGMFDGIVAGSPALDFNNLQSWRANFYSITGANTSSDFIPQSSWKSWIHDEILKQCDGLDGALDGIIEDPGLCNFEPEEMLCKYVNQTKCLDDRQAGIIHRIFSPFYGKNGTLIYPAMQPGSEIMAAEKLYAGAPFSYSEVLNISDRPSTTMLELTMCRNGSNTSFIRRLTLLRSFPPQMLLAPKPSIPSISGLGHLVFYPSVTKAAK